MFKDLRIFMSPIALVFSESWWLKGAKLDNIILIWPHREAVVRISCGRVKKSSQKMYNK